VKFQQEAHQSKHKRAHTTSTDAGFGFGYPLTDEMRDQLLSKQQPAASISYQLSKTSSFLNPSSIDSSFMLIIGDNGMVTTEQWQSFKGFLLILLSC
jgi:hypothetical protein